jgi:hypothetical protein
VPRMARFVELAAVLSVLVCCSLAAPALAIVPEDAVTGTPNSSNWFSGSLLQQPGLNCSTAILGSSYTEIMVSGIAAYGGAPGGGIPKVGDPYWTSFLISIPGNPCGPGSSSVQTELVLPPNTSVDTSRQIRCFGEPRSQNTFVELTGGSWNAFGSSGPYCPSSAGPGIYNQGALSFGFRPLASGQLFQIFVPVKSTATLVGAGTSPADGFRWLTNATGVYANPGLSTVWANVLPGGTPSGPFVYFTGPPAIPFWDTSSGTPDAARNRVEFFANLSSSGFGGSFCFDIRRLDGKIPDTVTDCAFAKSAGGWNDVVAPGGNGLLKVQATGSALGPNGGYAPFSFDQPTTPGNPLTGEWDVPMRITWSFNYNDNGPKVVSNSADFRTLAGPDADGDGVPDASDACAAVKGTLTNGCLPGPEADPDKDGVYGGADLCPTADGQGAANGCPGGVVAPAAPTGQPPGALPVTPAPPVSGALAAKRGSLLRRAALGKGLSLRFTCSRDASARVKLLVSRKVAKGLKLKAKGATVPIATGKGVCRAPTGGSVKLKLLPAAKRRVGRARKRFAATVQLVLSAPGSTDATTLLPVKVG